MSVTLHIGDTKPNKIVIFAIKVPTRRLDLTTRLSGLSVQDSDSIVLLLVRKKERNVLFNDALNTFYLRLYGKKERKKCFI